MNDNDEDILSGDIEDALPEEDVVEDDELDLEAPTKPKKDPIDDDAVSLEEEAEEELGEEDEPFDDITNY